MGMGVFAHTIYKMMMIWRKHTNRKKKQTYTNEQINNKVLESLFASLHCVWHSNCISNPVVTRFQHIIHNLRIWCFISQQTVTEYNTLYKTTTKLKWSRNSLCVCVCVYKQNHMLQYVCRRTRTRALLHFANNFHIIHVCMSKRLELFDCRATIVVVVVLFFITCGDDTVCTLYPPLKCLRLHFGRLTKWE